MKTRYALVFLASMLAITAPAFAGHEHHGGAAAEAQSPPQALAEIDPAADKGGCEKCRKKGMGGMHGGGMGSMHGGEMGGCKCGKGGMGGGRRSHGEGDCPRAAALEDRIDELEKRLDLLQMLLMRGYR